MDIFNCIITAWILLAFLFFLFFKFREHVSNLNFWHYWDNHKFNFPLTYKGRTIWYGRTVATTLAVFTKWENEIYVLANLRGKGCPDYNGYWNLICGYLEFANLSQNYKNPLYGTGEYNCYKEAFEETGVILSPNQIKFHSINTSPLQNKQNVSLRYYTILNDIDVNNYQFDLTHSEKDEVTNVKWIKLSEIRNYNWAFNHLDLIEEISTSIKI